MKNLKSTLLLMATIISITLSACQPQKPAQNGLKVMVVENFLADIVRQVAGERVSVKSLIPLNVDPHAFEPTPRDIADISDTQVLVINGAGIETWLNPVLNNAGGQRLVIEASKGLKSRTGAEIDPHFWMDPTQTITYVKNIRDGLIQVDPAGAAIYQENSDRYIQQLKGLDTWIFEQVKQIPPEKRLLVTNHESFGYFADRYGFIVVGTIIAGVSTDSAPSAQDVTKLINQIRSTGSPAVFLEIGANPDLARQIAGETGVRVITDLYTESLTDSSGPAPTYIDMLKTDVSTIMDALK
jgi:ABC-type Zn uptake system ZnuABC Zn-binding protein ZnuA